jgi:rusticyanin
MAQARRASGACGQLRAGIAAAVAVAGLSAAVGGCSSTGSAASGPSAAVSGVPSYSWYRSMMGRYFGGYGGSMMGGTTGTGWMMGAAGYQWMLGGGRAPAWMRGARLPIAMMGTSTDMGKVMGRLFASAPGPRVSSRAAAMLGSQIPAGAVISRTANTITFASHAVTLTVVASPPGGQDERFRIAGLTDPKIIVPAGARVSIEVVNADPDTAHGLVITASYNAAAAMPMMTGRPAFPGSALWFLGNPTSAGMHAGTITFDATTPGSYQYLCPVPGHARDGMTGTLTVVASH